MFALGFYPYKPLVISINVALTTRSNWYMVSDICGVTTALWVAYGFNGVSYLY